MLYQMTLQLLTYWANL